MRKPNVFIIVLNWNNYEDTAECLLSLNNLTYENYHVVLVDNGSTDGSAQRLQREFPHVYTIINRENLGFAAGCNVGIKDSLEKGADGILLINNDAILKPLSLRTAIQSLFSSQEIGIVGGKILCFHDHRKIDSVGVHRVIWPLCLAKSSGTGKLDRGQFELPKELIAAKGALMLIKRRIFDKIGLLSEDFFLGGEDLDFCIRARKAGFKVMYEPRFVAFHKVGASHNELSPDYLYHNVLSKQVLIKRHLPLYRRKIDTLIFRIYVKYWYTPRVLERIRRLSLTPSSKVEQVQKARTAIKAALREATIKNSITLRDWERWAPRE